MVTKEVRDAIEVLRAKDKDYIKEVLKEEKSEITYDCDYSGWCIKDQYATDYLYNHESTYLNPKELESVVEEVIGEEIFPIEETAKEFISYYEAKWGLDDVTEDKISSKITSDAEFHIFDHMGLFEEVIKQLKEQGVEIK